MLIKSDDMINTIKIDSTGVRNFLQVHKATLLANELLQTYKFYNRIAQHKSFDLADVSPGTIAKLMRESNIKMYIHLYHSISPSKNYDGYYDPEDPTGINLNIWKIDRSPASICNTIIHSCVHAVNAQHPQYHFGHGDTTLAGKENTAPYRIGALAQQMVSADEAVIIPLEHDHYEPRIKEIRKRIMAPNNMIQQLP